MPPHCTKPSKLTESCEHCNPDGAEIPFDHILDRVAGSDPSVTDYILEAPAKCPNCRDSGKNPRRACVDVSRSVPVTRNFTDSVPSVMCPTLRQSITVMQRGKWSKVETA